MPDPQSANSLLQPGETLGPATQAPVAAQADPNAGLLRQGETLGPAVLPAVAPPTPPSGVGDTLKRETSSLLHSIHPLELAAGIYHAAADPATDAEKDAVGEKNMHDIGPTGRLLARTFIEPAYNAASYYKKYVQATPDERIGMQSDMLSVAPEAMGAAGGAVLLAKGMGLAKAAATPMGAALAEGAEGPAGATMAQRVAGQVGTNVPFTGTQISDLAKRGLSATGDAAANAAKATAKAAAQTAAQTLYQGGKYAAKGAINIGKGVVDAVNEHVNSLKSDISDEVQQAIKRPSGNGMHADIQDIIEKSADGADHVVSVASQLAADLLDKIKTNAATAGDVSSDLVDKAVNKMVDEYYLRTGGARNPMTGKPGGSVSGASVGPEDATPAWDATKEPTPTFRGTVSAHDPQAAGPTVSSTGMPGSAVNTNVGVGPSNQPLRTPLATLADQEPWAKQLQDAMTRGQNQAGWVQSLETKIRRSPVLGRIFSDGPDRLLTNRLTQTLRDGANDTTLHPNAISILRDASKDVSRNGRFNLTKTVQTLNDALAEKRFDTRFRDIDTKGIPQEDWDKIPAAKKALWQSHAVPDADVSASLGKQPTAARMELLRDSLEQADKDIKASTRFGEQPVPNTATGMAISIAQHMGVKWMIRKLFVDSSDANENHALIRMLSNVPVVPEEAEKLYMNASNKAGLKWYQRIATHTKEIGETDYYKNLPDSEKHLIDRQAESVVKRFGRFWKGRPSSMGGLPGQPPRQVLPGQAPLPAAHPEWNISSAHPGTHVFSYRQWLQNNGGKTQEDARQAGRDAEDAGYQVVV
jgi:hypothetical protein